MGTPPIQVKLFKDNILLASNISTVYSRWTETATYTCFANNSFGTDSRDFQVTLLGKYVTGPYWTNTVIYRNNTLIYTIREAEFSLSTNQSIDLFHGNFF